MPAFAPVERPAELSPVEEAVADADVAVGIELNVGDDDADVELEDVVDSDDVLVGAVGKWPLAQAIVSPVAVGREAMFSRMELSVKATVRDVDGHQHGSGLVIVFSSASCWHAYHSKLVPLQ